MGLPAVLFLSSKVLLFGFFYIHEEKEPKIYWSPISFRYRPNRPSYFLPVSQK